LHGSIGFGNLASFIERKMIRRRVRCTIMINKRVANIVLKGMVNGTTTLVVDLTCKEINEFSFVTGRGGT